MVKCKNLVFHDYQLNKKIDRIKCHHTNKPMFFFIYVINDCAAII
ncbi:hypothetical protein MSIBF_A1540003 [groundwater metagenome]|uniref:Uncharacterized protein n=1 Tax=groundwater metagenome TaxID=717931 RepID=A0A098E9E9_9ZZZZ